MEAERHAVSYIGAGFGALGGTFLGAILGWFTGLLVSPLWQRLSPGPDCDLNEVGTGFACIPLATADFLLPAVVASLAGGWLGAYVGCRSIMGRIDQRPARATARWVAALIPLAGVPALTALIWISDAMDAGAALVPLVLVIPAACGVLARWLAGRRTKAPKRRRATSRDLRT